MADVDGVDDVDDVDGVDGVAGVVGVAGMAGTTAETRRSESSKGDVARLSRGREVTWPKAGRTLKGKTLESETWADKIPRKLPEDVELEAVSSYSVRRERKRNSLPAIGGETTRSLRSGQALGIAARSRPLAMTGNCRGKIEQML